MGMNQHTFKVISHIRLSYIIFSLNTISHLVIKHNITLFIVFHLITIIVKINFVTLVVVLLKCLLIDFLNYLSPFILKNLISIRVSDCL